MTDTPDSDDGTVLRDLTMLALLGFVALVAILLPHIHPPTEGEDSAKPAGNVIVEARWPDASAADIDLWIKSPGDAPVGYTRKHGHVFDLLRDDLGSESDETGLNYEFAFARGAPDGEYIVTVNWYSNRALEGPLTVRVAVSIRPGDTPTVIASRSIVLTHAGHDVTVARFTLADGRLVAGSVHDTPVRIRP